MFRKKILSLTMLVFMLFVGIAFVGCDEEASIELYQAEMVYQVTPGGSLEFSTTLTNVQEEDVVFQVTCGDEDTKFVGNVLHVSQNEQVGTDALTVFAVAGDVKSNEIKINVVDLKPTALTLIASNTKLAKGGEVVLGVGITPEYATLTLTTFSVVQGAEYVNITENKVTIKDELENQDVVGKVVKVQAVLSVDNAIVSNIVEIELVDNSVISQLVARNVNYRVGVNTNLKVGVDAYNEAGDKIEGQFSYTYSSEDESIAFVQNDGTIIPYGHGKTTVTITSTNGVSTTCDLFVMIPANKLILKNVSKYIQDNKRFSYGKAYDLELEFEVSNNQYTNCSKALDYTFELLNGDDEVVAEGADVATMENSKITFKTTGKVQITVKCNTSLNNVKWSNEQSMTLFVDVNNGINVNTVAGFKAYAGQYNNTEVNITADLLLNENENFGGNADRWYSLGLYGDRIINGNGYDLSIKDLPLKENNAEGYDFLIFQYRNSEFNVQIRNFNIIGCTNYDGVYVKDGTTDLSSGKGVLKNTYKRAINIVGVEIARVEEYGKWYVKDLVIDNCYIDGFACGLRINHAVNGYVSNVTIKNSYSNAIESSQNIITFNNMTFGQVGAFDIENTPDEMVLEGTTLHGTAGVNYDLCPNITMTGYLNSANYNNGASTVYMQKLGFPIPTIINTVIAQLAQSITTDSGKQSQLSSFAQSLVYQNIADQGQTPNYCVNFYLLLFVDPTNANFTSWVLSNPETANGVFGEYGISSSMGSVLDLADAMNGLANEGAGYVDYINYRYIKLDLRNIPSTALGIPGGYKVNIGQVVIVNPLYQA